jgi:FlaA1/EpsC-like NDP-sugar epimerase
MTRRRIVRRQVEVLDGKHVLVTGGTGSLGGALVRRLLTGEMGSPAKVTIFSRDEAKQHEMRVRWTQSDYATDDVAYRDYARTLEFRIGDVRDYAAVLSAVNRADVVFHAAALKQVPSCEYAPYEAVQTNVVGATNVVRAILSGSSNVSLAIAISTDKACKPVNVMGMTKALQERVFVTANLSQSKTRFMCVRYGNVISSRGSVVPLFLSQIQRGGPVTVTLERMTRFLITLDQAVDTIFAAAKEGAAGDTYIPRIPAANIMHIAKALIGDRPIRIEITGIRPGEKIDEVLISEEEVFRTVERGKYYVIRPMLPELSGGHPLKPAMKTEYSSSDVTLDVEGVRSLLGDASLRDLPH